MVRKHPKVSAAITLSVKANIVLALDKNVFILPVTSDTTPNTTQTGSGVVSVSKMTKNTLAKVLLLERIHYCMNRCFKKIRH